MAEDYYKTLEIAKTATQDEIQKAYLKQARRYHPDMNLDDPETAKKKFQEVQAAFDVLKDPEKRAQYDQFGPQFEQYGGHPGGQPGGGGFHWTGTGGPGGGFGGGNINLDDILGMFGAGGGRGAGGFDFSGNGGNPFGGFTNAGPQSSRSRRRKQGPIKGDNLELSVDVPFQTAIRGGKMPINLRREGGKIDSVEVKIPAGIDTGKKIRLRGLGAPGTNGGEAGALILDVKVGNHPFYSRKGKNLYVRVPVTLKEAALGGKIDVPTPDGTVSVTIPSGSTSGTKLRLRGRGIASSSEEDLKSGEKGDLFIEFEVQLPNSWSKSDQELLEKLDCNTTPAVRSTLHF